MILIKQVKDLSRAFVPTGKNTLRTTGIFCGKSFIAYFFRSQRAREQERARKQEKEQEQESKSKKKNKSKKEKKNKKAREERARKRMAKPRPF